MNYNQLNKSFYRSNLEVLSNVNKNINGKCYGKIDQALLKKYKGREIVIVGAGPSLKSQLKNLKEYSRNKEVLITVTDIALPFLIKHKIRYDLVFTCETKRIKFAQERSSKNSKLFSFIGSHPENIESFKGQVYLYNVDGFSKNRFSHLNMIRFESGGSIATHILSFAEKINSKKIHLFGMDLSFSRGKRFYSYQETYNREDEKIILSSSDVVPYKNRFTTKQFIFTKYWIEKFIKARILKVLNHSSLSIISDRIVKKIYNNNKYTFRIIKYGLLLYLLCLFLTHKLVINNLFSQKEYLYEPEMQELKFSDYPWSLSASFTHVYEARKIWRELGKYYNQKYWLHETPKEPVSVWIKMLDSGKNVRHALNILSLYQYNIITKKLMQYYNKCPDDEKHHVFRIIALHRNPDAIPFMKRFIDHKDPKYSEIARISLLESGYDEILPTILHDIKRGFNKGPAKRVKDKRAIYTYGLNDAGYYCSSAFTIIKNLYSDSIKKLYLELLKSDLKGIEEEKFRISLKIEICSRLIDQFPDILHDNKMINMAKNNLEYGYPIYFKHLRMRNDDGLKTEILNLYEEIKASKDKSVLYYQVRKILIEKEIKEIVPDLLTEFSNCLNSNKSTYSSLADLDTISKGQHIDYIFNQFKRYNKRMMDDIARNGTNSYPIKIIRLIQRRKEAREQRDFSPPYLSYTDTYYYQVETVIEYSLGKYLNREIYDYCRSLLKNDFYSRFPKYRDSLSGDLKYSLSRKRRKKSGKKRSLTDIILDSYNIKINYPSWSFHEATDFHIPVSLKDSISKENPINKYLDKKNNLHFSAEEQKQIEKKLEKMIFSEKWYKKAQAIKIISIINQPFSNKVLLKHLSKYDYCKKYQLDDFAIEDYIIGCLKLKKYKDRLMRCMNNYDLPLGIYRVRHKVIKELEKND